MESAHQYFPLPFPFYNFHVPYQSKPQGECYNRLCSHEWCGATSFPLAVQQIRMRPIDSWMKFSSLTCHFTEAKGPIETSGYDSNLRNFNSASVFTGYHKPLIQQVISGTISSKNLTESEQGRNPYWNDHRKSKWILMYLLSFSFVSLADCSQGHKGFNHIVFGFYQSEPQIPLWKTPLHLHDEEFQNFSYPHFMGCCKLSKPKQTVADFAKIIWKKPIF